MPSSCAVSAGRRSRWPTTLEAGLALLAAWLAGSVALLGFGADSVVESLSAGVLL
jgi:hypothetical protein